MPSSLIDEAGMCGLPSVYFLFGVLQHIKPAMPIYSYEGPFGVGYGVALYVNDGDETAAPQPTRHDIRVDLARQSISFYLQHHTVMSVPKDTPEDLLENKAGAFVSLHKGSNLRGCIDTFLPMQFNEASEIIHNAVSAATRDPRFYPLKPEELKGLSISVDILGTPEPVSSTDELDPKKYGVIVMSHAQTGLLLPDLEGVYTVQQQLAIAKEKAGIGRHHCRIAPGQSGRCRTRRLRKTLYTVSYGACATLALDPIAKKPLQRFHPGRMILSVGSWGCNLSCAFCQNWQIAQAQPPTQYFSPDDLTRLSLAQRGYGNIGVAFTYNEPLLSYEYIMDTAPLLRAQDLAMIMVSS